jgi:diguanylate cyclase (GGDEF)-like protein
MAERLQSTQMHLIRLAETDPLTGLLNRRAFFERLDGCLQEHPANAPPLTAIMFDIDFFKKVNDAHGHLSGDEVIAAVAAQAAQCGVLAGRLGGEEFALVLSGADDHAAVMIAEDLRTRCAGLLFPGKTGPFGITCSLGIASAAPGDGTDDLLRKADRALYEAKAAGRNCTRMAGGPVSDWWGRDDSSLKLMHS